MTVKIFVLNMERAAQRRQIMRQRLEAFGLVAEFLPAIDGSGLRQADLPPGTEPGLSPGEKGCYLSHVLAWKIIVSRRLPHAIILEDDVIIRQNFLQVVDEIIALEMPFDVVRLSALAPDYLRPDHGAVTVGTLSSDVRLVLPKKMSSGTQGYLVSYNGARRLLSKISVPKEPVDDVFDTYWKHGLCIPVLSPTVVEEDSSQESTIVGRIRWTYRTRRTPIHRLLRFVEKKRRKLVIFLMARRLRRFGLPRIYRNPRGERG